MSGVAYVQGHNALVYRSHESRKAADTCGYFLSQLATTSKVLDAGCGPGSVTASLASLLPDGEVLGVDVFETAINKARAQPNLPANCTFEVADLRKLPYPDDHFDVVYTSQVLSHIPEAVETLTELRRVCKPGGFVALREGDFPTVILQPTTPALEQWKRSKMAVMFDNKCHPDAGRLLFSWALQAGFDEAAITCSFGSMVYAGTQRKFWGETMSDRVASDQTWREHAVQSGITEADLKRMQEGWAAWMADPGAVFVMPCGEVICRK